jgi:hypothetical protein
MASYTSTILNLLYAGERMRIEFKDIPEREAFRKALYREKANQDKAVAAILDEDQSRTLFFKQSMEDEVPVAVCWVGTRERNITFQVLPPER